jgi:hypothetical protein
VRAKVAKNPAEAIQTSRWHIVGAMYRGCKEDFSSSIMKSLSRVQNADRLRRCCSASRRKEKPSRPGSRSASKAAVRDFPMRKIGNKHDPNGGTHYHYDHLSGFNHRP